MKITSITVLSGLAFVLMMAMAQNTMPALAKSLNGRSAPATAKQSYFCTQHPTAPQCLKTVSKYCKAHPTNPKCVSSGGTYPGPAAGGNGGGNSRNNRTIPHTGSGARGVSGVSTTGGKPTGGITSLPSSGGGVPTAPDNDLLIALGAASLVILGFGIRRLS